MREPTPAGIAFRFDLLARRANFLNNQGLVAGGHVETLLNLNLRLRA
ncbi:MAG: hypothetical protein WD845_01405 [Pirellulales bacterium]